MIISRRSFLVGLVAAPIIVRPGIIMPVKPIQGVLGTFVGVEFIGGVRVHSKIADISRDLVETGRAACRIPSGVTPGKFITMFFDRSGSCGYLPDETIPANPFEPLERMRARRGVEYAAIA